MAKRGRGKRQNSQVFLHPPPPIDYTTLTRLLIPVLHHDNAKLLSWQPAGLTNPGDVSPQSSATGSSGSIPQLPNSLGQLKKIINHLKAQGIP